jgi:hypothetical protein
MCGQHGAGGKQVLNVKQLYIVLTPACGYQLLPNNLDSHYSCPRHKEPTHAVMAVHLSQSCVLQE